MHREAFLACPSAHAGCSASFKGLASVLEKRVQLADGVVGMDAVGMLRTDVWLLSGGVLRAGRREVDSQDS